MNIKTYKGRPVSQIIPVGGEAFKVIFSDGGIGFANLEALTGQSKLMEERKAMEGLMPSKISIALGGQANKEDQMQMSNYFPTKSNQEQTETLSNPAFLKQFEENFPKMTDADTGQELSRREIEDMLGGIDEMKLKYLRNEDY